MACYLVFFTLAVWIYEVHPQACGPVLPLPPCPLPCVPPPSPPPIAPCLQPCPQIINPNPQITTIVDNSVSNALVNALQLLIISNLIGAAAGPSPPLLNLGPLLNSIACENPCSPEIVPEYPILIPCPNVEVMPRGPITSSEPSFEVIPPCPIDIPPPPFCGLPDLYSPNFFTYTDAPLCIDTLPPNVFNGYTETICPIYGTETIAPNYCGGLPEIITPNYYPVVEICPYYGGLADVLPTLAALPNMYGGLSEVVAPNLSIPIYGGVPDGAQIGPLAALAPNFFGGLTEVVSQVPLAAEVVFPSAIPAQLTCNFGYTQSSLPCVRVNVEPLPYDICNGYGTPIYY